jgi:hypothetical protein
MIALSRSNSLRYSTRMKHAIAICLLLTATPATAWNVSQERDRLTDKTLTWASVTDQGATLLAGCLNGQPQPRLVWDRRIGWGTVGVSYRFDDGPVVPRMAMISSDGATLYPWIADHASAWAKLKAGKRLRVQLGQTLYDFDLTQGGAPLPLVRCN